jgi:hypothetical protein
MLLCMCVLMVGVRRQQCVVFLKSAHSFAPAWFHGAVLLLTGVGNDA